MTDVPKRGTGRLPSQLSVRAREALARTRAARAELDAIALAADEPAELALPGAEVAP